MPSNPVIPSNIPSYEAPVIDNPISMPEPVMPTMPEPVMPAMPEPVMPAMPEPIYQPPVIEAPAVQNNDGGGGMLGRLGTMDSHSEEEAALVNQAQYFF